ncbi:MAG TPA: circularly permuted type 2 ATP-grasp protein, partial [Alphaproteobacteria bacterium]|nr:circularly permuted type 2 ATP-grasp protein [Alphaproteobacteria bacterium]
MSKERPIAYDEMSGWDGHCRRPYDKIKALLAGTSVDHLNLKSQEAELLFRRTGITFAVYGEGGDPERLIPFDIIPRVLDRDEWTIVERGLIQRVRALNMFLWDAYHGKEIVRAGKIPAKLVTGNKLYIEQMANFDLPQRTYTHIAGIDIVRTGPMDFYVL